MKKLKLSALEQIIFLACLSSLSLVLDLIFKKLFASYALLRFWNSIIWLDGFKLIPLFFIPLVNRNYFWVFISVSLIEIFGFCFRGTIYPYNPLLTLFYGLCLGIGPILLLSKCCKSFFSVYWRLSLICALYFITSILLNLFFLDCIFYNKSYGYLNNFYFHNRFIKRFLSPWIYFRFLSVFFFSGILTYIYLTIYRQFLSFYLINKTKIL
ncbi:MAG: hypothetical protein Q8897_01445 [Sweet potato little leaf phytoplasma]|uniref:Uncharacterized protein n=7 Tax=Candidatus Phytoplasma TaxID=33926 RepID=A0A9K3STB8_9MOLU|nr:MULTISPECIES: hypothetical protein [Phytoplasma]ASM93548.1 hypothetical protein [Alfalfa witches'-broom phytoplasma]ASM93549.1 hypothetical protein [Cucumber phyllody phytoplasma]QBX90592.1 hypothetical protein [Eggplant big bud phytoplasma]QBX90593.1 hypothetical protein [Sugar beet witches'-broom phytoplasma]QBX90595.1 hypothetical protein [Faba bean phyllody phytoplasma]